MSRDYKHRVPGSWRKPPKRRRRSDWVWIIPVALAIVAVVAVIRFAPYGKSSTTEGASAGSGTTETATAPPTDAKDEPSGAKDVKGKRKPQRNKGDKVPEIQIPEPRFSFYKILPEKEVIVSESEIRELAREENLGRGTAASYMVQAGSFSRLDDAEKLRARLAEVQVKAKTEKVIIESATWYRVKIGPYKSLADAERVRSHLRKNSVDSVLQQAKTP
ncbi:MAG: SPOR domain-containing protein [Methylotetracoccus sp.]